MEDWLDACTDRLCTACRHLRDLAKSRTKYVTMNLKTLMDMVDIDEGLVLAIRPVEIKGSDVQKAIPMDIESVDNATRPLQRVVSDASSVSSCAIVCSFACRCADCFAPEVVSVGGRRALRRALRRVIHPGLPKTW